MPKACAITGDRPTSFKFGYKENYSLCKKLKRVMAEQIKELYENGVTCFYIGGSLGVDIWAGEIILRLKEQTRYEAIELVLVIPYKGYDSNWDERSRKRLEYLIKHSKACLTAGDINCQESYVKRNYYMVDQADCVLAICGNDRNILSTFGKMLSYATKRKRNIIFINPDTAETSSPSH